MESQDQIALPPKRRRRSEDIAGAERRHKKWKKTPTRLQAMDLCHHQHCDSQLSPILRHASTPQ